LWLSERQLSQPAPQTAIKASAASNTNTEGAATAEAALTSVLTTPSAPRPLEDSSVNGGYCGYWGMERPVELLLLLLAAPVELLLVTLPAAPVELELLLLRLRR